MTSTPFGSTTRFETVSLANLRFARVPPLEQLARAQGRKLVAYCALIKGGSIVVQKDESGVVATISFGKGKAREIHEVDAAGTARIWQLAHSPVTH